MRPTVVVPSDRHLEAYAARAAELAAPPLLVTFRRLRDWLRLNFAPEWEVATPAETRLCTRLALLDIPPYLRPQLQDEIAGRTALAVSVDRAIGVLRQSGAAEPSVLGTGSRRSRLIAAVIEHVDRSLADAQLIDRRSLGQFLAPRITSRPDVLTTDQVTIEGQLDFHNDDMALIEAMHGAMRSVGGPGVTLVLPSWETDGTIDPIADRLERRWASLLDAPELRFQPMPPKRPIAVMCDAYHPSAEARAIASHVAQAIAAGARPERIAVVVPDLDEGLLAPMRAAFEEAMIPICEPRGRPVHASPEARAALSLLSLASGPVTRDLLIDLLRAPGLHAGRWMGARREAEARARATELAHVLRAIPVVTDRTGQLLIENLNEAVKHRGTQSWMPGAVEKMLTEIRSLSGTHTRKTMIDRILVMFEMLQLGQPSAEELARAIAGESHQAARALTTAIGHGSVALSCVRTALESMRDAAIRLKAQGQPVELSELCRELEVSLELEAGKTIGGPASGAVSINRATSLCGLEIDFAVFTRFERAAYASGRTQDGVLSSDVLEALPDVVRPRRAIELDGVRNAELSWLRSRSRQVMLTRTIPQDGSVAEPPHPWFSEVSDETRQHVEPASRVLQTASTVSARGAELSAAANGKPTKFSSALIARVEVERARQAFFLDPRSAPGPHSGAIDVESFDSMRSLVGGDTIENPIAVTAVETMAGCAFAGFARSVLRARRISAGAEVATAQDRGTLVHRALCHAFEAAFRLPNREDDVRLDAGRRAAEDALGVSNAMSALRRESLRAAIHDAMAVLREALSDPDPVRFSEAERRFGRTLPPPWSPLAIESADGSPAVFVEGQIDRIDRATDGRVRIVDYKTGRAPETSALGKTALQLPIYAEVVARAKQATGVDAIYRVVKRGGKSEVWPKKDQSCDRDQRQEAMGATRLAVVRMWRGDVAPRPTHPRICARCDARDICRRPTVMPVEDSSESGR